MYKTIMLETATGELKEFPFLASGATAIRYMQVFNTEIMTDIAGIMQALDGDDFKRIAKASSEADGGNVDIGNIDHDTLQSYIAIMSSGHFYCVSQLAYIMNMQATKQDMRTASYEGYLDWIDEFESLEFMTRALDIIEIYIANRTGSATVKKNPDQQTEK